MGWTQGQRRMVLSIGAALMVVAAVVLVRQDAIKPEFAASMVGLAIGAALVLELGLSHVTRSVGAFLAVAGAISLIALAVFGEVAPETEPQPGSTQREVEPTEGAFPYQVVNVGQLGLFVRTCPDENCGCAGSDCEKLGAAAEDTIMWTECQLENGYVPSGLVDAPWYRVRWTNDTGGTREIGAGSSAPEAPHRGWSYSTYLEPLGGEWSLPEC